MLIFSPEVVGTPLRTFANQTEPNPSPRARERRQAQMTATSDFAAGAGLEVLIHYCCRHPTSVGNDECRDAAKIENAHGLFHSSRYVDLGAWPSR
jgi:hypothetical protein